MHTDEAMMKPHSSSVYTELDSYIANHPPSAVNMAVKTSHTAEGQLSSLEALIERKKKENERELISI